MRILLTGHTKGIGKATLHDLSLDGHDVIGYSRVTGHDVSDEKSRQQIVADSLSADVFINNAFEGDAQCKLAMSVWKLWHEKQKSGMILNIGSRAAYDHMLRPMPIMYDMHKIALRELSLHLSRLDEQIRVCHLAFGYVQTDSVADKIGSKLDMNHAVSVIKYICNLPKSVQIRELCMEQKYQV